MIEVKLTIYQEFSTTAISCLVKGKEVFVLAPMERHVRALFSAAASPPQKKSE
ncbi:MAG TPA: hypothetical protein PKI04_06550 [Kaistella sp.]|nr:hypothetical protein [Kaistella sp.]